MAVLAGENNLLVMSLLKIPKNTPFFDQFDGSDCVGMYISNRLYNAILTARFYREKHMKGDFTAGDILKMNILEFKAQRGVGHTTFNEFLHLLDCIEKD